MIQPRDSDNLSVRNRKFLQPKNGIESIDKNIGKSYSRIRIGIGKPINNSTGADHVLDNFSSEEIENVEEVTKSIIESLSILINKDLDLFSSKINQN